MPHGAGTFLTGSTVSLRCSCSFSAAQPPALVPPRGYVSFLLAYSVVHGFWRSFVALSSGLSVLPKVCVFLQDPPPRSPWKVQRRGQRPSSCNGGPGGRAAGGTKARPSRRYLGLLQRGAREAGLDADYVERLDRHPHHVTPAAVRAQTQRWIAEFEQDPARRGVRWTAEELARFDGSAPDRPAHTSAMGYVVAYEAWFTSWRGHTITRRNLLHVRGESVDAMDIRAGEPGFLPLPDLSACSPEEQEFLWQNLEHLLHGGGRIVGRLQEFLDAQP